MRRQRHASPLRSPVARLLQGVDGPRELLDRGTLNLVGGLVRQRLPDDLDRQPGRVSLASENTRKPPNPGPAVEATGRRQPSGDQRPRRRQLGLRCELAYCGVQVVFLDTSATQLMGEGPPRQPTTGVPGVDPGPGEGRVIDETDLGEPAQDSFDHLVGDSTPTECPGEFGPGARLSGQLPEDDGASRALRIDVGPTVFIAAG